MKSKPVSFTPHIGRLTQAGPSLQIEMTVNGLPVQAVVDTGAEVTVISEEVYNKLPTAAKKPLSETSLHNAGVGSMMFALGELELTLGLGSQKIDWKVFVGQIQDSLLLGLDAMQAADVTIVAGQQVFIGTEPVPSQVIGGDGEEIPVASELKKSIHHDRLKHPVRPPEHSPDPPQPCQLDWTLLLTDRPKNCLNAT